MQFANGISIVAARFNVDNVKWQMGLGWNVGYVY